MLFFNEGRAAYLAGQPEINPYTVGSFANYDWRKGYRAAKRKAKR